MDPVRVFEHEWPVIAGAPVLVILLVVVAALVAWRLRGTIDRARAEGLEAQKGALEQRLALATEQEKAANRALGEASTKMQELTAQIAAQPALQALATTSSAALSSITIAQDWQNKVSGTLGHSGPSTTIFRPPLPLLQGKKDITLP
jgi:hypothetical protein